MPREALTDPKKLDIERWCRAQGRLHGELAWRSLQRLQQVQSVLDPAQGSADPSLGGFSWIAQGQHRQAVGREPLFNLDLQISGRLLMACQRCLQPTAVEVSEHRHFRLVGSELEAEKLDQDSEDADVLALERSFDLLALVEDEVLLALPLVPMHLHCPQALPGWSSEESLPSSGQVQSQAHPSGTAQTTPPEHSQGRPHPFAALAKLKT